MSVDGSRYTDDWRTFGALEILMTSYVALALALPFLIPPDLYDRSAAVRAFADGVASVVRTIHDFANISSFPGVTRVTLAILWALVPVLSWLLMSGPGVLRWNPEGLRAAAKVRWPIIGVFIFFSIVAPIFLTFDQARLEGRAIVDGLVTFASTNRFGLGLIAGLYCAFAALFLSLIPTYLNRKNFE